MAVTEDSRVVLLLCSRLGLPASSEVKPLTLAEWNAVATKLAASGLGRPGGLLTCSAGRLQTELEIAPEDAGRIMRLLDRGGALAIELERLESRGVWIVTRADDAYPRRLKDRLKARAPAVLFGAGDPRLLGKPGLAVVGSRDIDETLQAFAAWIGAACVQAGRVVYSGAARGVDKLAMGAALDSGGQAVGVVAESLERAIRTSDAREALQRGDLALISDYGPDSPFSVGVAMGRNKLIYALADFAIVVASGSREGGTWAGAVEALKHGWVPVFVLNRDGVPDGNASLVQEGAIPFVEPFPEPQELWRWMTEQSAVPVPAQGTLF